MVLSFVAAPFWLIFVAAPFWLIYWRVRFRGIITGDIDYQRARRNWTVAVALWLIMLVVFVAMFIIESAIYVVPRLLA